MKDRIQIFLMRVMLYVAMTGAISLTFALGSYCFVGCKYLEMLALPVVFMVALMMLFFILIIMLEP